MSILTRCDKLLPLTYLSPENRLIAETISNHYPALAVFSPNDNL